MNWILCALGNAFCSDFRKEKGIIKMGAEKKGEGREGAICEMWRLYLMCVVAAMLLRIATPGPLDAVWWLLYSFPLSSTTQYLLRSPPPLLLFLLLTPFILLCAVCMYVIVHMFISASSAADCPNKQDKQYAIVLR
jgi:hypothetical protein